MIDPVDEDQEATTDSIHSVPQRRRRRLILNFSREQEEPVDSGGEGLEQSARLNRGEEPVDIVFVPHARATTVGFQSLDDVDLTQVFEVPAMVMKSIPKFMRGAFRGALKLSLQEIQRGSTANNSVVEARGWKLFFLLPRLLLFRPPRGGLIPRGRLQERLARFAAGDWEALLLSSLEASMQGSLPVAEDEGDMLTTWPVVYLVQLDWRTLGSCQGPVKHWKEMPLHQVMKVRGSC